MLCSEKQITQCKGADVNYLKINYQQPTPIEIDLVCGILDSNTQGCLLQIWPLGEGSGAEPKNSHWWYNEEIGKIWGEPQ